jgi:predicted PurR-regulated permease PerM
MASNEDRAFMMRAVETSIRIGLIALLVIWCFQIVRPFIQLVLWGIILAIAVHPAYVRLCHVLGGRERLSAIVLVVGSILLLTVPSVLITTSLVDSTAELAVNLHSGDLKIPPPPPSVADWPIVGERLHALWATASRNLEAALGQAGPLVKATGQWILSTSAAAGFGIVMFALSIVIAGVLLSNGDGVKDTSRRIARRLVHERGDELIDLTRDTVESVTLGILGVALIQGVLAGIGLLAAGVPAAGLWALLVLLMAVIQLPTVLLLLDDDRSSLRHLEPDGRVQRQPAEAPSTRPWRQRAHAGDLHGRDRRLHPRRHPRSLRRCRRPLRRVHPVQGMARGGALICT